MTSTLYWILVYLIGRRIHEGGELTSQVWAGVIVGLIGGAVLSLVQPSFLPDCSLSGMPVSPVVAQANNCSAAQTLGFSF